MGYWGEKIFQSDTALDLIDEITDDAGLELYMFDDDTAVTIARDALNAGILATLVAKYTADPPDMWDDPNHKIFMLVALAMQTGAIVSKELRTVVRTLIRRIATPEQAKKQMRTALRVSTLREPYNFDSPGLVETAMMRMHEQAVPAGQKEDQPSRGVCMHCRRKASELGEGEQLMRCSQCRHNEIRYCSRECQKKDWKVHKMTCTLGIINGV